MLNPNKDKHQMNIVTVKLEAVSHDRPLHLSGVDDGWFAGFW